MDLPDPCSDCLHKDEVISLLRTQISLLEDNTSILTTRNRELEEMVNDLRADRSPTPASHRSDRTGTLPIARGGRERSLSSVTARATSTAPSEASMVSELEPVPLRPARDRELYPEVELWTYDDCVQRVRSQTGQKGWSIDAKRTTPTLQPPPTRHELLFVTDRLLFNVIHLLKINSTPASPIPPVSSPSSVFHGLTWGSLVVSLAIFSLSVASLRALLNNHSDYFEFLASAATELVVWIKRKAYADPSHDPSSDKLSSFIKELAEAAGPGVEADEGTEVGHHAYGTWPAAERNSALRKFETWNSTRRILYATELSLRIVLRNSVNAGAASTTIAGMHCSNLINAAVFALKEVPDDPRCSSTSSSSRSRTGMPMPQLATLFTNRHSPEQSVAVAVAVSAAGTAPSENAPAAPSVLLDSPNRAAAADVKAISAAKMKEILQRYGMEEPWVYGDKIKARRAAFKQLIADGTLVCLKSDLQ